MTPEEMPRSRTPCTPPGFAPGSSSEPGPPPCTAAAPTCGPQTGWSAGDSGPFQGGVNFGRGNPQKLGLDNWKKGGVPKKRRLFRQCNSSLRPEEQCAVKPSHPFFLALSGTFKKNPLQSAKKGAFNSSWGESWSFPLIPDHCLLAFWSALAVKSREVSSFF